MTSELAMQMKAVLSREIDEIAEEIIHNGLTCRNLETLCHLMTAEQHINTTNMLISK